MLCLKSALFAGVAAALFGAGAVKAVPEWGQCGGINYTGSKTCDSGLTCVYQNDWYSQCLRTGSNNPQPTPTPAGTSTVRSGPTSTGVFYNPIKTPNGSDPFMVWDGGYYYLMSTTWSDIKIHRATTIAGLKTATPKTVWTRDSVASRCCNYWAPEVHKINGVWYLYYTAGAQGDNASQRVHVLRGGGTPYDNYVYQGQIMPPNAPQEWALDATVLTVSGQNYLVWSGRGTAGQVLYIATMSNPWTVGNRVLFSEPLQSWERGGWTVNEGPVALYKNGAIYVVYSGSLCSTPHYALGYLKYNGGSVTSRSSWTKVGPVVSSANGNYGTGHNGFVTTPGGMTYLVYHATADPNGNCGGGRYTSLQPMSWAADGITPIFPVPAPFSQAIPAYT